MFSLALIHPDLIAIRKSYALANQSKSNFKLFNAALANGIAIDVPIKKGYSAASLMIQANFEINPFHKLAHFNDGKALLEATIGEYQTNAELHFIRFTIQERCPKILGYSGQLMQDKLFLMHHISDPAMTGDEDLVARITSDLLKSESLTEQEKLKIKQIKK